MDPNDPRIKTWGMVLGGVVLALALVDSVALRGDTVASCSLSLREGSSPESLTITHPGEKHLVKITTRKTVRGETRGLSIHYRLLDPDGAPVVDETELLAHKKRYFSFYPTQAGDYQLYGEEVKLLGTARGTAHVVVTVNDRRVLSRLLGF